MPGAGEGGDLLMQGWGSFGAMEGHGAASVNGVFYEAQRSTWARANVSCTLAIPLMPSLVPRPSSA